MTVVINEPAFNPEVWRNEFLENFHEEVEEDGNSEIREIYNNAVARMVDARWKLQEAYADNCKRDIKKWQKQVDYYTALRVKALEELRLRKASIGESDIE